MQQYTRNRVDRTAMIHKQWAPPQTHTLTQKKKQKKEDLTHPIWGLRPSPFSSDFLLQKISFSISISAALPPLTFLNAAGDDMISTHIKSQLSRADAVTVWAMARYLSGGWYQLYRISDDGTVEEGGELIWRNWGEERGQYIYRGHTTMLCSGLLARR